jgi:hypothetical protein
VARSGTRGTTIEVQALADDPKAEPIGRWYVRLLRRLGYPTRLSLRLGDRYYAATTRPGHRVQMGLSGWYADTPYASSILPPIASCRRPATVRFNQSGYCDASLEAAMRRAHALEATDAAASARRWAAVDHAIVRSAAVLPLFTTPDVTVTSSRVRDYQYHPRLGPLLAQASVTCSADGDRC